MTRTRLILSAAGERPECVRAVSFWLVGAYGEAEGAFTVAGPRATSIASGVVAGGVHGAAGQLP